jgi:hypothetical protein
MLLAEIHGHALREVERNEDYLTSAVFGHLRYIPPRIFWEEFFGRAKRLPCDGDERSLAEYVAKQGPRISEFSTLEVHFWPSHPKLGQPDMLLHFAKSGARSVVILIEVKLWSEKSGTGEDDQLVRYLRVLNDLPAVVPRLPKDPIAALVYLTPRESAEEIRSSVACCNAEVNPGLLFRAQWQDLLVAVSRALPGADRLSELVLRDISLFLRKRGLEYFNGFGEEPSLPFFKVDDSLFYRPEGVFEGFRHVEGLEFIQIEEARGFYGR